MMNQKAKKKKKLNLDCKGNLHLLKRKQKEMQDIYL